MRGVVLYNGPSELDGKPIIVVATFISGNEKTGNMVQTWILRRGMSPIRAINIGADRSCCGTCKMMGSIIKFDGKLRNVGRSCYVKVSNAPNQVWRSFKRGIYSTYNPAEHAHLFSGRKLRMGSYGDPAAVPIGVWESILPLCDGHSGYTHQWRTVSKKWARYLMASVDTPAERRAARKKGYRTFRTRAAGAPIEANEIVCPASAESGKRRTCETCLACHGGNSKTSITIEAHGSAAVMANYKRLALPMV